MTPRPYSPASLAERFPPGDYPSEHIPPTFGLTLVSRLPWSGLKSTQVKLLLRKHGLGTFKSAGIAQLDKRHPKHYAAALELLNGSDDATLGNTLLMTAPRPCVYFITCGAFVKIGYSTDVVDRFASIDAHNPHRNLLRVAIPGDRVRERYLHKKFADYHHKLEWFRHEGLLAEFIDHIIREEAEANA